MRPRLVVGAALGDCVHVAGILNFLAAARAAGYDSEFLGPGVPIDRIVAEMVQQRPELVALSYRLTPAAGERLFAELATALDAAGLQDTKMVFGGTARDQAGPEPSSSGGLRPRRARCCVTTLGCLRSPRPRRASPGSPPPRCSTWCLWGPIRTLRSSSSAPS